MTWGAVNELTTLNGYRRVIARTRHPVLRELLGRIVKDERRHFAFYFNQARIRLASSARAQHLVRWALDRFWQPVGTGVRPQEETDFVIVSLFGDPEGRSLVEQLDADVDRLPGLGGLQLFEHAADKARRRASAPAALSRQVAAAV